MSEPVTITTQERTEFQQQQYENVRRQLKIKEIAQRDAYQISQAIEVIGTHSNDPEAAAQKIIDILEQTTNDKKQVPAYTAALMIGKIDPKIAAPKLSGLFLLTGMGEENTSTRKRILFELQSIGTKDAASRVSEIGTIHPEEAIQTLTQIDAPNIPALITKTASQDMKTGQLTSLQTTALKGLMDIASKAGTKNYKPQDITIAANRFAKVISFNLEKSLKGGTQYKTTALDFRPESELKPNPADISALISAFRDAQEAHVITNQKTINTFNQNISRLLTPEQTLA